MNVLGYLDSLFITLRIHSLPTTNFLDMYPVDLPILCNLTTSISCSLVNFDQGFRYPNLPLPGLLSEVNKVVNLFFPKCLLNIHFLCSPV